MPQESSIQASLRVKMLKNNKVTGEDVLDRLAVMHLGRERMAPRLRRKGNSKKEEDDLSGVHDTASFACF